MNSRPDWLDELSDKLRAEPLPPMPVDLGSERPIARRNYRAVTYALAATAAGLLLVLTCSLHFLRPESTRRAELKEVSTSTVVLQAELEFPRRELIAELERMESLVEQLRQDAEQQYAADRLAQLLAEME